MLSLFALKLAVSSLHLPLKLDDPDLGIHPRDDFLGLEGFPYIIRAAHIETLDLGFRIIER